MTSDLTLVIGWWVVWFFMGIGFLPLTNRWLGGAPLSASGRTSGGQSQGLWDRGYSLAKILGWVAVGYVVWLGASLEIWRFGKSIIWLVLFAWIGINYFQIIRDKRVRLSFFELVKENWRLWGRLELLFLGAMTFWAVIRGFQPDINGLEKLMDFGFVNSVMRSDYFPPVDMWFVGKGINYYYFGHYLSGVMTMLSGIKPAIAYNLMLATLFGLSVSGAVSVGGTLVKFQISNLKSQKYGKTINNRWIIAGGFLTAFLLAVRGNLHTAAFYMNKWMKWNSGLLPSTQNAYWYPDATRYIPFTIHEFPMYSFVVADLHAHLINLPIVLLFIGGLVVMLQRILMQDGGGGVSGKLKELWGKIKKVPHQVETSHSFKSVRDDQADLKSLPALSSEWWGIVILGWLLGVFAMTNAWDVPIYGLVTGVSVLILGLAGFDWQFKSWKITAIWQKLAYQFWELFKRLWLIGAILVVLTIVVSLPFQLHFEQIAKGILPVDATSEISKLLVLWGWDLFLCASLVVFVGWVSRVGRGSGDGMRLAIWDWVVLGWYGVGWLLIAIPEFVYVKDIYIADYHRANTMFKLVYQSWTLFAFAGAYTIIRLVTAPFIAWNNKYLKYGWIGIMLLGIVAVGVYPKFAVKGYYGDLKVYKGLDGEEWLKLKHPDDYAGIVWLRELSRDHEITRSRDQKQPVVLEAVGDSYTEFDRVSAYTGYPTIQGWLVHEWLWRGAYDEPGARAAEVEKVYTSADLDEVRLILSKYHVDYVFVGDKEREKYPLLRTNEFRELGEVVFESGDTRIYELAKR